MNIEQSFFGENNIQTIFHDSPANKIIIYKRSTSFITY